MIDLLASSPEWSDEASCRDVDPELFFHPDGERGDARDARDEEAKAVCAGCPVRAECLTYAIESRQEHGVWGGLSEDERRSLIRRTKRKERQQ